MACPIQSIIFLKFNRKKTSAVRQKDRKLAACTIGSYLDPTALCLNDFPGQRKPQAHSVHRLHALAAVKAQKDLWNFLERDSAAGVGNIDAAVSLVAFQSKGHPSPMRGILDCVVQNVEESLFCPLRVTAHRNGSLRRLDRDRLCHGRRDKTAAFIGV